MPELPEVETTTRGLNLIVPHQTIQEMQIYNGNLRWPVDQNIIHQVKNGITGTITRRSKYLLLPIYTQDAPFTQDTSTQDTSYTQQDTLKGRLMIHLGMSGRLQVVHKSTPREKHSHLDWILNSDQILRYTDPRRFGSVHWLNKNASHSLLDSLGPEPLEKQFNAQYLYTISRNRKQAIKVFIMNAKIVVGVGNIYASEALFKAKIHPNIPAQQLNLIHCQNLVKEIKKTLKKAIKAGGTTLKDFQNSEGKPGYFQQQLNVYGRAGEQCQQCHSTIHHIKLGQRATYFCPHCQNENSL